MCHLRLPCWFQHCLSPTHTTRTITVRWNQYPELRNQSIKKFNNINQSRIHQPLEANTLNRQNLITGGLEELIKKQEKKKKGEVEERKQTFSDGFDISAGSTSGVDGFLVALGGGVRGSLSDHHRLPILRHRSNSCHDFFFFELDKI